MLHHGDDYLIALADELATVAVHDEIYAFGDAAHEYTLARLARTQEALDLLARALVCGGRTLAQVVDAAVYVRVLLAQVLAPTLDDDARDLRRGGVVEVDERLAVDGLPQNGKVLAHALNVPTTCRPLLFDCLLCRDHLFELSDFSSQTATLQGARANGSESRCRVARGLTRT